MGSNVYYFGCIYYLFWKVFFSVCLSLSKSLRLYFENVCYQSHMSLKRLLWSRESNVWSNCDLYVLYLHISFNDFLTCTSVCFCFISFFQFHSRNKFL